MADSKYSEAESVEQIAAGLIPNNHPDLAVARIMYVFTEKSSMKGGVELLGKAKKASGLLQYSTEKDFIIEVAVNRWNDLTPMQRNALIDSLLERCKGEEDEKTGDMKWQIREPDVQEFSSILERHGAWNDSLTAFVEVAQTIELDGVIEEEADISIDDLVEQSTSDEG